MPLIISSLALHHVVNHMIVQCHRRLTKPKLGKVKCHPQIRFQIRGGLVGNCNTCSRCEAAGVHVQKTMSSRHCILPAPGTINAGRNYTNCLLGCRFGLTEAQRPCGAINLGDALLCTDRRWNQPVPRCVSGTENESPHLLNLHRKCFCVL
jgi:hypothetical protein